MSTWSRIARQLGQVAVREAPRLLRQVQQSRRAPQPGSQQPGTRQPGTRQPGTRQPRVTPSSRTSPSRTGERSLAYAPQPDGRADPGEVVWTWVAYEDDPGRGKDRPVLVVGRQGRTLLGLMLSSQDDRDGQRDWLALGPGAWDREQRPSWVRLDRVLEVDEDGVRREGAVLDRRRFDLVAERLRASYGWD